MTINRNFLEFSKILFYTLNTPFFRQLIIFSTRENESQKQNRYPSHRDFEIQELVYSWSSCQKWVTENWAASWENLFMLYANNKGANQPAHPRSLISTFIVSCLDCIMSLVSISEISSLYLVSVATQGGLSLTWSETPHPQPRSLISTFIVSCLDCIMSLVSISEISSLYLVSVATQGGLSLTWSETPKTDLLVTRLNWAFFKVRR